MSFRRKQYAEDRTLGHTAFWGMILAEVRAEANDIKDGETICEHGNRPFDCLLCKD